MLDMCGQHGVHVTYYWITTCYIHEYIKYIGPPFKKIFQENISHLRVFIAISKRRYGIMSHCRDLSMWKFMHYKYMMIWFKQRCTCYLPKCIWSKRGQLHMPCFGPTLVWNGSKHFFFTVSSLLTQNWTVCRRNIQTQLQQVVISRVIWPAAWDSTEISHWIKRYMNSQ